MIELKNLFISAYITLVCYFIGAFIFWDYNAGSWTEFGRVILVLMWLCINIVWVSATLTEKHND